MIRWCCLALTLMASGCLPRVDEGTSEVGFDPFGPHTPPPQKRQVSYAPASENLSERVEVIGRKILGANPQIGLKPYFATIGSPSLEVFHQDVALIYVTSGLVQKCQCEEELAAVLSVEMGRMVAEREAAVHPLTRKPAPLPPISMPIGNDRYPGNTDGTHLVELGKYEKEYPRTARRLPPPDPFVLAGAYLENAGYAKDCLEKVGPLLKQAEQNVDLERQFRGVPQGNWTPLR